MHRQRQHRPGSGLPGTFWSPHLGAGGRRKRPPPEVEEPGATRGLLVCEVAVFVGRGQVGEGSPGGSRKG